MSIGSSPFQGGGSASIADATESTAGKIRIATTSESNTGTNDVTAMTPAKVKARIDAALVGGVEYKGSYTGQSLVTADKGDLYVSAATYSLAGVQVLSGDHIIFNQDAADPVTSAMFDKIDNTDQVSSVNTETGAVVLNGANLDGDHSPSNYSATTDKIEKHLEGIDTALGARQPLDAQLTDVAGLTPADGAFIVGDGSNFVAESGATARASLGLAIGSDVQAFDAQLTDVAGLTPSNNHVIVGDGSNFTAAQLASTQLSDSADLARLASPALTGTPTAPTATSGTNTTQLATTAFVQAAVTSSGSSDTLDTVTGRGATTSNTIQVGGLNIGGSYALPTSDGSAGQTLKTDGSGALTFQSLGSISTQAANSVNITGGAITGITDLAITDGGTGASTESQARTNLGLAIGSDVQAFDAQLTDVAGLTPADGAFIVGDGSNFVAESGATARASLGLAIGSDVQAFDAQLTDVAGLTPSNNHVIVGDGSNFTAAQLASTQLSDTADLARLASPALTGTPTAPTATSGTNTTQLATTAFVQSAVTSSSGVTPTLTVRGTTSYTLTAANAKGVHVWYGGTTSSTFTLTLPAIADVISTATTSNGDPEETFEVYVGRRVAGDITVSATDTIDILGDGSYSYQATQTVRSGQWIKIVGWYQSASTNDQFYFMSGSSQPYDAGLQSISGLTTAADKMIYSTGSDTYAVTSLTAAGRALLDDADAAAQRTTLGLAIGSDVQAFDAQLTDVAGLTPADGAFIVGDGSNFVAESGATARASLGLAIGSDVLSDVVQDTSPQLGGNLDLNGQDIVTTSNANLELAPDGTGVVSIKGNTTGGNNQGALKLWCENNSHGISIKSPPHSATASYELVLPTGVGTDGQVLKTDGGDGGTPNSVQLAWVDQASGGGGWTYSAKTASDSPVSAVVEYHYSVTGATTITLPAAASGNSGKEIRIKVMGSDTVTVGRTGSDTIDGAASDYSLDVQYSSITLVSNGSNGWEII